MQTDPDRHSARGYTMNSRLLIAALFFGGFVANMNNVALVPYLSPIASDIESSVPLVGQAQMAGLIIGAVMGLSVGPLSDHYGLRRVLIFSGISMALCGFGTALAFDYWVLVLARIPGGLAFGMIMGLGASIATRQLPEAQRRSALGWMVSGAAIAVIVGAPALAFIGDHLSWRVGFAVVGTLGLLLIPSYILAIPADSPANDDSLDLRGFFSGYQQILADRRMFGLQSATVAWGASWTGLNTYLGAFAVDSVGVSLAEFGYLFMVGGIFFLFGSQSAPYLCRFWAPRLIMLPVAGLLFVSAVLYFTVPTGVAHLALIFAPLGFAGGAGLPLMAILVSDATRVRPGSVMMLRQFCYGFGSGAGAAFGGVFLSIGGYAALAFGLGFFALLSFLVVIMSTRAVVMEQHQPIVGTE